MKSKLFVPFKEKKKDKMNKKGFTLIELLAVIVILGVILVIAIPSISAAILNARKNSYVVTANEFVDGVRIASLTDPTILPGGDDTKFISIADIKLEKGSKTKSPFGKAYIEGSGVYIKYDATNDKYIYSICLVDENNNGINLEDIINVDKSDVKIGGATCTGLIVLGSLSDWSISPVSGGYTISSFLHICNDTFENGTNVKITDNYFIGRNINTLYEDKYGSMGIYNNNFNAYTIYIPNEIDGKNIIWLENDVFSDAYWCETPAHIISVIIPEGIITIGDGLYYEHGLDTSGTFFENFHLEKIELPSTLKNISSYAFSNTSPTNITIPANVENIGFNAFYCVNEDAPCNIYVNRQSIPSTFSSEWAAGNARVYVLNGASGYTCIQNCP